MPALEEGQKFERYRVIRQLGQGVAGISYEAEDMMLRRRAMLKLVHPWSPLPDSARRQFFRDMQGISLFAHPYQAATLDYGEVDGQLYTVRRFVAAGSLLNNEGRSWYAPPLSVTAAITYTHQIAQALYNIHRYGHVHGSLTLSNLLVVHPADHAQSIDTSPFLLADVGLAHFVRRFGHPQIARLPITSAPEQARGRVTPACDQYALAAILYFWLAGRPPFLGAPDEIEVAKRTANFPVLSTQNPQVTLEQEGIIRRALSAYPEERYPSVLAFAEILRASLHPLATKHTSLPAIHSVEITTEPLEDTTLSLAIVPISTQNTRPESERGPLSSTFILDQQTLRNITELAKEEDQNKGTNGQSNYDAQSAEPISSTFIMDPDLLRHLAALAQDDPKPLPQIDPDLPLPHPETTPVPTPEPPQPPTPPEKPEPGPDVILPPAPDIAQPLPDKPLPLSPNIARPLPETPLPDQQAPDQKMPNQSTQDILPRPSTDKLRPITRQAVVLPQLVITSPYTELQDFTLIHEKTTLGRAGSSTILLDQDTLTSRHHAYILRENERYLIYDDDSIHGVYVNEQKLAPGEGCPLSDEDQIRIGEYHLMFHMKVAQYIYQETPISDEHVLS
jgi:serine/threonine protein kinase